MAVGWGVDVAVVGVEVSVAGLAERGEVCDVGEAAVFVVVDVMGLGVLGGELAADAAAVACCEDEALGIVGVARAAQREL